MFFEFAILIYSIIIGVVAYVAHTLNIYRPDQSHTPIVTQSDMPITGGSFYDFTAGVDYKIPSRSTVVIDGHNVIHAIDQKTLHDRQAFRECLEKLCPTVLDAFPDHKVHIVLKNYYAGDRRADQLEFIKDCTRISKDFPRVTIHVAQDPRRPEYNANHTSKGRDDLLTVWLARNNGYIISHDFFRDIDNFHEIGNFDHYTIRKGRIVSAELLEVKKAIKQLERPTHANQLLSRVTTDYPNGTITMHPAGKYRVVNFKVRGKTKK